MARFFTQIKEKFSKIGKKDEEHEVPEGEEYVQLDQDSSDNAHGKIIVRPFNLEDFADIKEVLDVLREGNTIALINIRPLKDKDIVELKRAINKLKNTCDAIEGDVAGFGDDWIVATPKTAMIHRSAQVADVDDQ